MTANDRTGLEPDSDDIPTSAQAYGWMLGGSHNREVDRQFILGTLPIFPECVDIARQNREFLYRAVRHLVLDHGIRQFVDMGCGLPTDANVHQVAARFAPDTRVVYVDADPAVARQATDLLDDPRTTTLINADMRDPDVIVADPEFSRLIDLREPLAVLFLSVGHHLVDADDPRRVLHAVLDRAAPGSFLGVSQVVADDADTAAAMTAHISAAGMPWQTRTPAEFAALVDDLVPIEPGLVDLRDWRPDPHQPALAPVPAELAAYAGITGERKRVYEYGGVLAAQRPA